MQRDPGGSKMSNKTSGMLGGQAYSTNWPAGGAANHTLLSAPCRQHQSWCCVLQHSPSPDATGEMTLFFYFH